MQHTFTPPHAVMHGMLSDSFTLEPNIKWMMRENMKLIPVCNTRTWRTYNNVMFKRTYLEIMYTLQT